MLLTWEPGDGSRQDGGSMPDQRADLFEPDGANVLLLAPAMSDRGDAACRDLLAVPERTGESAHALLVTYRDPERTWIRDRGAGAPDGASGATVISVGGRGSRGGTTRGASPTAPAARRAVANPGDFTGLGIALNDVVAEWESNPDADRFVACFDSVTFLLQYAELERAFQFLHAVTARLHQAGAVAHFHIDPGAHDERTVATLAPLFDALAEVDEDGLRFRTR